MITINARNAHLALPEACRFILKYGEKRETRNGVVLQMPAPLTTCYGAPVERVVFWPERDANPFFHLFEALWMLAGRRDVAFVSAFNSNISKYSDDGEVFHGAYGYRWKSHFDVNQLGSIAFALKRNPQCRRQVLAMWDPKADLGNADSRDLPCNTHAYFQVAADGKLDMMVCNRSNDLIWGKYGANVVHFSFLLEYMAALIMRPPGRYWHTTFNAHVYLEPHQDMVNTLAQKAGEPPSPGPVSPYEDPGVNRVPLVGLRPGSWLRELNQFFDWAEGRIAEPEFVDTFFRTVAVPYLRAWRAFKSKSEVRFTTAQRELRACGSQDWFLAAYQWLDRRAKKWEEKRKQQKK